MASIVNTKGVDISYWNGDIDLAKVKNAGYSWVMIRCGWGNDSTSQDDSKFAANVAKAEKLGMPWGVYLFSYACSTSDAKSELAHIDRLLKEQKKKRYLPTLPIAIDIEPNSTMEKNGAWTSANLTNVATIVLDGLKNLGYYPIIYTGYDELAMMNDHIRNDYDCWFAQWYTKPSSYKYNRLGIWQYGGETNYLDNASIPGVGVTDQNIAYKDYPTIIKNGGYNGFTKSSSSSSSSSSSTTTTTKYNADTVVSLAKAEVGYKEKASNSQLQDKTANAGSNNWNKYADYIDNNCPDFYNGKKNGYAWCDIFVDYIHIKAAGSADAARAGLYQPKQSTGAGCIYSAQFYRNNNAFTDRGAGTPKVGDQIFFGTKGNEYHTGIVVKVDSSYVYTIEGNSSEMVAERKYSLTDSSISGYGHPKYTDKSTTPSTSTSTSKVEKPSIYIQGVANGRWLGVIKDGADYAGILGKALVALASKVSKGSIKYSVHIKGGGWLGNVTGFNYKDYENGYAGLGNPAEKGSPIDAVKMYYTTPSDVVKEYGYYRVAYRVHLLGGGWLDWQYDTETTNGQDGYAGIIGKTIDGIEVKLVK